MPISGTQPALTYARVGLMRVGGSRLGYIAPWLQFTVNGVDRSSGSFLRIEDLQIVDYEGGQPNVATMRVHRFTPVKGHEIKIGLGGLGPSRLEFAGHIQRVQQVVEAENPDNVAYDLTCVSYEWLLNRRKVTKRYISQTASGIARDLIASFTSGFTFRGVDDGLAVLDEFTLTNEDVADALDRLAKRIGAYWYIDYGKDLKFFTASPGMAHPISDAAPHGAEPTVSREDDLTPVRTRCYVEGQGSTTLVPIAVGAATIPLQSTTFADEDGGVIVAGPQRIDYSGKSDIAGTGSFVDGKTLTPSAPTGTLVAADSESVSSITRSGTTATVTTSTPHGWNTGHKVRIAGAAQSPYNGLFEITVTGSTTFTYTVSGSPATPATGTITATRGGAGNLQGGDYRYQVTFDTVNGESEVGTTSATVTVTRLTSATSSAMSLAEVSGSTHLAGDYSYRVTFYDAFGETIDLGSPETITISAGVGFHKSVDISNIPTSSDARAVGRKLYRLPYPGATTYVLLGVISDNTTTTFQDRVSEATMIDRFVEGLVFPSSNTSGSGMVDLTSIPLGPTGTRARRIYRTEADGDDFRYAGRIGNNTQTIWTDNVRDTSLGEDAPAASEVGGSAGDTVLRVKQTENFSASGGWVQVGSQVLSYTGIGEVSGSGNLLGIPASGIGSIAAQISYGAAVVNAPFLTGVSGVLYALNAGDEVNLLVTRNDTTAQAAMAALVGGDGIHEEYIQDRRISQTEAEARGDAKLLEVKDPIVTVNYHTRDKTTRSGYSVTFDLAAPTSLSGTFKIQQVTITDFDPKIVTDPANARWPRRSVMASSRRESFDSLLRILKRQAA